MSEQRKVRVDLTYPGKKEQDPNWPNILELEETGMLPIKISYYDGMTKEDPGNPGEWIDVAASHGDANLSTIWSWDDPSGYFDGSSEDLYYWEFAKRPKTLAYEVQGNSDSRVPAATIASEFAADNADRFTRKPLAAFDENDRDNSTDKRWDMSNGFFNIGTELYKSPGEDPIYAAATPDLAIDGEASRLKIKPGDVAGYKSVNIPPVAKFYLMVTELGSKAFSHQLSSNGTYSYSWLEPPGIYWSWFNTADDTNFKVTKEPSFSADAVSGKFIRAGNWKVFLMPRRWFYYVRFVKRKETTNYLTVNITGGCSWHCYYPDNPDPPPKLYDNAGSSWWETNWDTMDDSCQRPTLPDMGNWWGWYTEDDTYCDYLMENSDEPVDTDLEKYEYSRSDNACTGCWCYFSLGGFGPLYCDDCEGNTIYGPDTGYGGLACNYPLCVNDITSSWTATWEARLAEVTHYIGAWWGRWPHDFTNGRSDIAGTALALVDAGVGGSGDAKYLIDCETLSQCRQHYEDAGGDADEAAAIVYGGVNGSIHHHRFTLDNVHWFLFRNYTDYIPPCSFQGYCSVHGNTLNGFRGIPSMRPFRTITVDSGRYLYAGEIIDSDKGIHSIWNRIEESNYWTNTVAPILAAAINNGNSNASWLSRVDSIPFGLGISPDMTGSLVGVVQGPGGPYFIWRKTDEEFEEMSVGASPGYCTFESFDSDGIIDPACDDWETTSIDQFYGTGRKLTTVGREPVINSTESIGCTWMFSVDSITCSSPGDETLHAPVYIMASKERAILDSTEWASAPAVPGQWPELKYRYGRAEPTDLDCKVWIPESERNKF